MERLGCQRATESGVVGQHDSRPNLDISWLVKQSRLQVQALKRTSALNTVRHGHDHESAGERCVQANVIPCAVARHSPAAQRAYSFKCAAIYYDICRQQSDPARCARLCCAQGVMAGRAQLQRITSHITLRTNQSANHTHWEHLVACARQSMQVPGLPAWVAAAFRAYVNVNFQS